MTKRDKRSFVLLEFAVGAVGDDATSILVLVVLIMGKLCEAPLLGNHNLLSAGEFVACSTKCLAHVGSVGLLGTDGENDLTNFNTCYRSNGLAKSATHSSL